MEYILSIIDSVNGAFYVLSMLSGIAIVICTYWMYLAKHEMRNEINEDDSPEDMDLKSKDYVSAKRIVKIAAITFLISVIGFALIPTRSSLINAKVTKEKINEQKTDTSGKDMSK